MASEIPAVDELALGAFLHDIGKLGQRALDEGALWDWVKNNEATLLPTDSKSGRHTHRHVLFTEQFFAEIIEKQRLHRLAGIDLGRAREAAVYHHRPLGDRPWTWLVTVADQLASGMERKERDVAHEAGLAAGPGAFRTTPLVAIQSRVRLAGGGGEGRPAWYPPRPLSAEALMPLAEEPPPPAGMEAGYRRLWERFLEGFGALAQARGADHVHHGLISLSERLLWSVPSSTRDEPDVSLHDHALAVAAIAACLYRFHEADGSLADPAAVRDRERPKFRLLEGDLSGIQDTLFRLQRQQVQGINRILRGRSFRLQAIAEATALQVRRALDLPPYVVLLRAGGRFTLLLPELPGLEERIGALQAELDRRLLDAYSGELALVLALSEPLAGQHLLRGSWPGTWRRFSQRREAAKLRALAAVMADPRIEVDFPAEGTCAACGVRPARHRHEDRWYCDSCDAELALGRELPRARAVFWKKSPAPTALPGNVRVEPKATLPGALEAEELSGFAIGFGEEEARKPTALPWRLLANHVPTWRAGEWDGRRFEGAVETAEDIDELRAEGLVTMAHLARVDLEEVNGRLVGRPMLAVLKADVDDLGQIFGRGLGRPEDRSLGRTVALSRLMDAFFSGWLPWRLRTDEDFRWIYTVYAGGDDLLLIGPWLTVLRFALELREAFRHFAAGNPDLHLSAGIEFVDADEPLNRSVRRAEERLEKAKKQAGKDRVSVIVEEPLRWEQLRLALEKAEWLSGLVREGRVPATFLHRLLLFADLRARAETADPPDLEAAMWNARLQYHLARQFPKDAGLREAFRELIGAPGETTAVPARVPLSIALWRNR